MFFGQLNPQLVSFSPGVLAGGGVNLWAQPIGPGHGNVLLGLWTTLLGQDDPQEPGFWGGRTLVSSEEDEEPFLPLQLLAQKPCQSPTVPSRALGTKATVVSRDESVDGHRVQPGDSLQRQRPQRNASPARCYSGEQRIGLLSPKEGVCFSPHWHWSLLLSQLPLCCIHPLRPPFYLSTRVRS